MNLEVYLHGMNSSWIGYRYLFWKMECLNEDQKKLVSKWKLFFWTKLSIESNDAYFTQT